jgi:cobalt-zinc-cadmium resistance protein CzcA
MPSITLGYNTATITGTGADNVVYDKSTRFQSAQFGLGIPLFGGAQRAKIKASKIAETIADNEFQKGKMELQQQFLNAQSQYQKSQERLSYYEKTALPNAKIISTTANKQFYNGEINYLDWVMLIHQSIAIQNDYINTVNQYNDAVIQLNYLTSKN